MIEAKEIAPEYVLQPNAISRAAYRLSTTARKIIAMGMSIIPFDLSKRVATFTYSDFCKSVGFEKGGESFRIFEAALDECLGCVISINTLEKIEKFTWVQYARIEKKTGLITIEFSEGLTGHLLNLKKMYAKLELRDIGKLKSLYAIRIFEIAKSYESLAGQRSNKKKYWYFEFTIEQVRHILGVEKEKYSETKDFRRYVIEAPLKEINNANLGLTIMLEVLKARRRIEGFKFHVEKKTRNVQSKNKEIDLPGPDVEIKKEAQDWEDKEMERLKKQYPDEYAQKYKEVLDTTISIKFFIARPDLARKNADIKACKYLIEKYSNNKLEML